MKAVYILLFATFCCVNVFVSGQDDRWKDDGRLTKREAGSQWDPDGRLTKRGVKIVSYYKKPYRIERRLKRGGCWDCDDGRLTKRVQSPRRKDTAANIVPDQLNPLFGYLWTDRLVKRGADLDANREKQERLFPLIDRILKRSKRAGQVFNPGRLTKRAVNTVPVEPNPLFGYFWSDKLVKRGAGPRRDGRLTKRDVRLAPYWRKGIERRIRRGIPWIDEQVEHSKRGVPGEGRLAAPGNGNPWTDKRAKRGIPYVDLL